MRVATCTSKAGSAGWVIWTIISMRLPIQFRKEPRNNMNTSAEPAGFKLKVSRVIKAPCEMIFRAWTEPKQLSQWFCPQEVNLRGVTADVKVGGAFRIHMVSPKGDHIAIGTYQEIVPNKRVRFTWSWETYAMPNSVVTVDF